jgi:hypothetical protein
VTVREEDWRRATVIGTLTAFEALQLQLDRDEAQALYDRLAHGGAPGQFMHFEDAWRRFGGRGPLLEFAFFVRENTTLAARLRGQLDRLRDEVNLGQRPTADLDLVGLVAVAGAYGARLEVQALARAVGLPDPGRRLTLLEEEYLVRRSPDGFWIEGLHPVRSALLTDQLTESGLRRWMDLAARALPLMSDDDLEGFLLSALSRRPGDVEAITTAAQRLEHHSWVGLIGVLRAFQWWAVRSYLDAHQNTVQSARTRFNDGWPMFVFLDMGGVFRLAPALRPAADAWNFFGPDAATTIAALHAQFGEAETALLPVADWLEATPWPVTPPQESGAWRAAATALFWLCHWGRSTSLSPVFLTAADTWMRTGPLDEAGLLAAALAMLPEAGPTATLHAVRPVLLQRFQHEEKVFWLESKTDGMVSHFLVSAHQFRQLVTNPGTTESSLNQQAVRRAGLLRHIVPAQGHYGTQGHGFRFIPNRHMGNPSHKYIQQDYMPPEEATRLTGLVSGIASLDGRPEDWPAYAETVMRARQAAVQILDWLAEGVINHHLGRPTQDIDAARSSGRWREEAALTNSVPNGPLTLVDEWGLATEVREEGKSGQLVQVLVPALAEFKQMEQPLKRALASVSNARHLFDKLKGDAPPEDTTPVLILVSLHNALEQLSACQRAFRAGQQRFVSPDRLSRLEDQERFAYVRALGVWQAHVRREPFRQQGAPRQFILEAETDLRRLPRKLGSALAGLPAVHSARVQDDPHDDTALWINLELVSPLMPIPLPEDVVQTCQRVFEQERFPVAAIRQTVQVVATWSGHLIARTAWTFSTVALSPPPMPHQAWQLKKRRLTISDIARLGLREWVGPEMTEAQSFTEAADLLSWYTAAWADLRGAPSPDPAGLTIWRDTINDYRNAVHKAFADMQQAADTLSQTVPPLDVLSQGLNAARSILDGLDFASPAALLEHAGVLRRVADHTPERLIWALYRH